MPCTGAYEGKLSTARRDIHTDCAVVRASPWSRQVSPLASGESLDRQGKDQEIDTGAGEAQVL